MNNDNNKAALAIVAHPDDAEFIVRGIEISTKYAEGSVNILAMPFRMIIF